MKSENDVHPPTGGRIIRSSIVTPVWDLWQPFIPTWLVPDGILQQPP
jgi:hypothetical protein